MEVFAPKTTFFKLVRKAGTPTRFSRFCCSVLKEYKVLDRSIQGIRRCESIKRAKLYKEPEYCRTYSRNEKARIYLPILEWSNEDVALFIAERNIKCHPLYYDYDGKFHVERRLGCIGCPLASPSKRIEQYLQYPKFLKALIKNHQIYIDSHPGSKSYLFTRGSAYNGIFHELFCKSREQYDLSVSGGIFPNQTINTKSFLEDYFKIDLTI